MKTCTALLLSACLFATQASALSCMRPNLAKAFNQFQDSDQTYNIALGKITVTGKIPPFVEGKPRKVAARFTGKFMATNRLGPSQTRNITLQTHCIAHWCGGFPNDPNTEQLLFLRQSETGLVLDLGACPEGTVSTPTEKRIQLLQSCLKRGRCSDADQRMMEKF